MKKILTMILVVLMVATTAFAADKNIKTRKLKNVDEISVALQNYYPTLYSYYKQGVLDVVKMKEVKENGEVADYLVKYKFVKYYYQDGKEVIEVVKEQYPDLYNLYYEGDIEIHDAFRYVDEKTGAVVTEAPYFYVKGYYKSHGGLFRGPRIYHRPRPYIPGQKMWPPVHPDPKYVIGEVVENK